MFWDNKTVTLFNRFYDGTKECWYPTLLSGVDLVVTKGINVSQGNKADADTAKLYVEDAVLQKRYLAPLVYARQEHPEEYMTFTEGKDFFVEGDATSQDTDKANFFEYMRKQYDNIFKVASVVRYEDVLPHFEVGGK
nr:MAG TPA: hypothetical protein [Caudoviricetes sp.]